MDEYKQLLTSKRYRVAMQAKGHLKSVMDKLNKLLVLMDEEKDQAVVLRYKAERTKLMKRAKGYLGEME